MPCDENVLTYKRDLRPIKRDQTHSQAMHVSKHLVHDDVFRCDPADPRKVGERLEKIAGNKVPDHASRPCVQEEAFTRDTSSGTHTGVGL